MHHMTKYVSSFFKYLNFFSSHYNATKEPSVFKLIHFVRASSESLQDKNAVSVDRRVNMDFLKCVSGLMWTQNATFCPDIPQFPGAPILPNLSIYPSVNCLLMWLWLNLSRYTSLRTGQESFHMTCKVVF